MGPHAQASAQEARWPSLLRSQLARLPSTTMVFGWEGEIIANSMRLQTSASSAHRLVGCLKSL